MSAIGALMIFLLFNEYICFNIDTNFPIVYNDPLKDVFLDNYFGYSVVLYPGDRRRKPWILACAPRGNNPNNDTTGVCFKCGIAETCALFDVDGLSTKTSAYKEKVDNAWIGGAVDINLALERIVICAPRYIKVKVSKSNGDDYRMQGACYWFHIDDNSTQKLVPLVENDSYDLDIYSSGGNAVYYFGQGEAGFSVHMPPSRKEMVLGAPGVFNWDGITVLYRDKDELDPVVSRLQRNRKYAEVSEFNHKNIGNAIETTQTLAYDLLGYSLTSGYFYEKSKLFHVASAPRSNYDGQVLIYEFGKNHLAPLAVKEAKHGEQFGEYFGGSLAAGDINGDGLDDLIVGAPFHKARRYNEGKVYVFLGSQNGRLQTPKRGSIAGTSVGSQFGTTVQYLGDINHDGFGDVAIAAPYEEEKSGVVYLYKGSSDGLDSTYCQRIVGRDIYHDIRGFGISISRAVDMDFNGYSDFAVGSHLSGHVILLRSRPVVTIYQTLESHSSNLNFNTKQFHMKACFWSKIDITDAGTISIERSLFIDQQLNRAYLQLGDEQTKEIHLISGQTFCENFTINLMTSFSNYYDPISISLSNKFLSTAENKETIYVDSDVGGSDKFCPRCPTYDKFNSESLSTVKVPFALGCKSGNVCESRLNLDAHFPELEDDNTFVVGSKEHITLRSAVENSGEKAYLAQLLVTIPETVAFRSNPSACTERNSSSYLCSVGNPLEADDQKTITLDIDMTNVNAGKYDEPLVFVLEVLTSSENSGDRVKELIVRLEREADVTINGESEKQSYSYRHISSGEINFTQIYQIETFGRSPLDEVLIEINIPHTLATNKNGNVNFVGLYRPEASLSGQPFVCTSDFIYIIEDRSITKNVDIDFNDDNTLTNVELLKRSMRQTAVFNTSSSKRENLSEEREFDAFQNRTNYLNCTMREVICSRVVCNAGPISPGQIATIKLKMTFNVSAIKDLLGRRDVFLFATAGRVEVTSPRNFVQSGDKADRADAATLFIGDSKEEVELWIIIVSAVAGILLLLFLVLGLIKAGFFKRKQKEELEQLKKEIEYSGVNESSETLDTDMTLG